VQAPYYPIMANHNPYGIKALNQSVIDYMNFACFMRNGCLEQIALCATTNRTSLSDYALCTAAEDMCRDNVESPYYYYSGRGVYDIRHEFADPTPPLYFEEFLNLASTQEAIGVDTNYTADANDEIYFAFQQAGDYVWPNFIDDLEMILNSSVRVSLIYGDADYICNFFGGEAVSLAAKYRNADKFRAAGYTPMVVDGVEYGETREYGNFSFTRGTAATCMTHWDANKFPSVYEAGHEVPFYQPIAALQLVSLWYPRGITRSKCVCSSIAQSICGTSRPARSKLHPRIRRMELRQQRIPSRLCLSLRQLRLRSRSREVLLFGKSSLRRLVMTLT
jgi:carboxypeptidase C (cathepsin A)